MIRSVLARQLQRSMEDSFCTTYAFADEPFKSSFDTFSSNGKRLFLESFIAIRLPFRTAATMPDCFEAARPKFLLTPGSLASLRSKASYTAYPMIRRS